MLYKERPPLDNFLGCLFTLRGTAYNAFFSLNQILRYDMEGPRQASVDHAKSGPTTLPKPPVVLNDNGNKHHVRIPQLKMKQFLKRDKHCLRIMLKIIGLKPFQTPENRHLQYSL